MEVTNAEKLILVMLCDIYKKLEITNGIDPEFVRWALTNGEMWAVEMQYPGIFAAKEPSEQVIHETVDVLNMWWQIEGAYHQLSEPDRERIASEAGPVGRDVRFPGFDGNNESSHLGVADAFIEKLDRFTDFSGRDLNSHAPLLDGYRRMLVAFTPIQGRMHAQLTADEIITLLRAFTNHPADTPAA